MCRMRDPREGQEIFPYHSGVGGHKKGKRELGREHDWRHLLYRDRQGGLSRFRRHGDTFYTDKRDSFGNSFALRFDGEINAPSRSRYQRLSVLVPECGCFLFKGAGGGEGGGEIFFEPGFCGGVVF